MFIPHRSRTILAAGIASLLTLQSARAATYTYDSTTSNTSGTATQWSAGTSWSAAPVSASDTTLTFGGVSLLASQTLFTNNDIVGNFLLNQLNFTYAGPATGTAPTFTISGNPLEFINDGATTPVLTINAGGTVKPTLAISNALVLTDDLSVAATTNGTLSGAISGTGTLTKSGAGVLTLGGAGTSTFDGGVTLSAGTLRLAGVSALGAGMLNIEDSTTLDSTVANLLLSTNNLQNWNGNFTFTGTQNLNLGTGAVTINANRQVTVTANTLTVGGGIGESGSGFTFTKAGAGTLVLNGNNTYSGGTTISAGVLRFGAGSTIPTTGSIGISSGGALSATGPTSFTNAGEWLASGKITAASTGVLAIGANDSSTANFSTFGNNSLFLGSTGTFTYSGALTPGSSGYRLGGGGGTLTVSSLLDAATTLTVSGNVTLTNANSYTGLTTVQSGSTLNIRNNDALGTNAGGTTINTTASVGASLQLQGGITITGETLTVGGTASGQGGSLSNALVNVSGNNVWAGPIDGSTTNGNVRFSPDSGDLLISGPVTISGAAGGSLVLTGSTTGTIADTISNSVSTTAIIKNGNSIWTLSGSNNYTGVTRIDDGVLLLMHANAIPGGLGSTGGTSNILFNLTGSTTVLGLGAGDFTRGLGTGIAQVRWAALSNGGFAAFGVDRVVNLGGVSAGVSWDSGNFVATGQMLILGAASADATLDFQNPINFGTAARTVQVVDGTAAVDAELSGDLTSGVGGGLTKTGSGTLVLSGNNTYSGATNVSAGALILDSANALSANSNLNISGGAVIGLGAADFNLPLGTTAGTVQWTGSGGFAAYDANRIVNLGGGSATVTWNTGSFVPTGSILILGSATADFTVDFQNPIDLAGAARTVQVDNGSAAMDAKLSGAVGSATAGSALTKTGNGTLLLSGDNTYVGTTTVSAGALVLGHANALGTTAGSTSVATGATVDLNGQAIGAENFSTVAGSLLNNGATAVTLNGLVTLGAGGTLGGSGDTVVTQGLAGGNVAFVKTGSGTVTLNANATTRTSSAATATINGGTLVVKSNGALGTNGTANGTPVTISNATLEINGTGLALDTGLSLNVSNGTTVRTNGSNATNARINISAAVGAHTVSIATTNAADLFTVGNGSGDVTGGNGTDDVIQISGPGTVRLGETSAYVGNWSLLSGTTQLGTVAAFGATPASTITLATGATLAGRLASTTVFTANPITVSGAGTATILADRSSNGVGVAYTFGPLSIGSQQLDVTNTAASTSGTPTINLGTAAGTPNTLTGNAVFNVNIGAGGATGMDLVLFGLNESGGSHGFTKNGTGGLSLASTGASYNYTGPVILNAGILRINRADALGTGTFTINGGSIDRSAGVGETLTTNNVQNWNGDFAFVGSNALNLGTGSVTLGGNRIVTTTANNLTVGGVIGDGVNDYGLTKAGAGTLVLTGLNTYSGGTTLSGGTLRVSKLANGNAPSTIGQSTNVASNLVLSGSGRLEYLGAGDNSDRLFDLLGSAAIASSGTGALNFTNAGGNTASGTASARTLTLTGYNKNANTISGAIVNSGTNPNLTNVVKTGSGAWVLAGTNTFTGLTIARGGTLTLDYSAAGNTSDPLSTGAVTLDAGGLALRGKTTGTTAETINVLNLGSTAGVSSSLTLDRNGGSGVNLTVTTLVGTGTTLQTSLLDLSSSASNSITVTNSGTAITSSGTNGVLLNGTRANVIVRDSTGYGFATLSGTAVAASTNGINRTVGKLTSGTTLTDSSSSGTANYFYSTAGTLTRTASLNYQTLTVDSSGGAIIIDFGTNSFATSASNGRGVLITGANDVSITGSGTLGTSQWIFNYGTGAFSLSQNLGSGGNLFFAGSGFASYSGSINSGYATFNVTGGITRLALDQTVSVGAGGIWVGSGGVLELGADLNGATAGDLTNAVGTAAGNIRFFGDSGLSAYTASPGGTRIANFGGAGATQTWGSVGFLTNPDGATDGDYTLKLSSARSNATIEVQNSIALNGRDRVIEVTNGSADVDARLSGAITGTGVGFTKTGAGTLTLTNAGNSYSGATNIDAGTAIVSGSLSGTTGGRVAVGATLNVTGTGTINSASTFHVSGTMNVMDSTSSAGAVNVNSGGILGGNGNVGTLVVANGGTVSPGNSPGTLHAGNTTFQTSGNLKLEFGTTGTGTAGADWDQLAISGTLDLTSLTSATPFILKLEAGALGGWNTNGIYRWASFITTTGGFVGSTFSPDLFDFNTTSFLNDLSGGDFAVEQVGNNLDLVYIPEPGSAVSLLGGLGLLLGVQRFRRSRVKA